MNPFATKDACRNRVIISNVVLGIFCLLFVLKVEFITNIAFIIEKLSAFYAQRIVQADAKLSKVKGRRILVMIDGWEVVDYLEPAAPYRTTANAGQLLSNGRIGFRVENGTLNIASVILCHAGRRSRIAQNIF